MRCRVGEKDQRRRQAAFVLMKMVLSDPGAVETQSFGVANLFGSQPIALTWRDVVQQASEKTPVVYASCDLLVRGGKVGNSGNKLAGILMLRSAEQSAHIAMFNNLARPQYRHAVGDTANRRQIVGDKQIGQSQLLLQLLQQGENLRLDGNVQRRSRFIEDKDRRFKD